MEFCTLSPQERTPALLNRLTALWERSIRATHHFLAPEDIPLIVAQMPQILQEIPSLTVAWDAQDGPVGFLGVAGHTLELLYLSPDRLGQGLGSALFHHGMAQHYISQIPVHEDNIKALDFYLRRSYRVHHRTPTDRQGRPYPILHLTLSCY